MFINVTEHNVRPDGTADHTSAIQALLDQLQPAGGTLYFPSGEYRTGSLEIRSNTTIELEAGAVLLASGCHAQFPVVGTERIEGYTRGTRQGLLFALNGENITVKGEGTIDGRGYYWWNTGMSDEERPRSIQFISCSNVKIEGITIINSPCWSIHPICCNNVYINGVTVKNPYDSPNTDGINPESCSNVRISNCCVDVGDDCITLKSGLEKDLFQKRRPCENIVITNCTFVHGHGGIVIGSEMSGNVQNVTVTNCIFRNTDRGIRIKTRRKRGGRVEDVIISNVIMDGVIAGITMNAYYCCGAEPGDETLFSRLPQPVEPSTPVMRNFIISNIIMKNVKAAGIYLFGLPEMPIDNVKITNADISVAGSEEGAHSVSAYGIDKSYGDGIFLKNVKNTVINDCSVNCKKARYITEHVENTFINGKKAD